MLWQRRAGLAAALVGAVSSEEKLVWAVRGSGVRRGKGKENIRSWFDARSWLWLLSKISIS